MQRCLNATLNGVGLVIVSGPDGANCLVRSKNKSHDWLSIRANLALGYLQCHPPVLSLVVDIPKLGLPAGETKSPTCLRVKTTENGSMFDHSSSDAGSVKGLEMAPVYLEDFTVCKPPDQWLVDWEKLVEGTYDWKVCCSRAFGNRYKLLLNLVLAVGALRYPVGRLFSQKSSSLCRSSPISTATPSVHSCASICCAGS